MRFPEPLRSQDDLALALGVRGLGVLAAACNCHFFLAVKSWKPTGSQTIALTTLFKYFLFQRSRCFLLLFLNQIPIRERHSDDYQHTMDRF